MNQSIPTNLKSTLNILSNKQQHTTQRGVYFFQWTEISSIDCLLLFNLLQNFPSPSHMNMYSLSQAGVTNSMDCKVGREYRMTEKRRSMIQEGDAIRHLVQ
ncbi:unnamed protein product [Heterobilharzia americana]|nr:unnamed protein product [Heterobilharzia americana]